MKRFEKHAYTLARSKKERKTTCVNLLIHPSAYADLCKIATMKRTSANDLINTIIEDYINANIEEVIKYEIIFKEATK